MAEGVSRSPALDTSLILLTGGQDVMGNTLLSLPTSRVADICDQSVPELTALFLRMMEISRYMKTGNSGHSNHGAHPVAFLADLHHAPTQALQPLVEVLEAIEHRQRGSIAAVYFLQPKSKSKSHLLKKLLGMKPSKKRPRVPLFKIVLMKTIQELYTQIDMRHLTIDFSGTLKYSHNAWMYLYENVVHCIEKGKEVVSKLPSVRDRVDLLQEYEPDGQSSVQLQQLLNDLTEKFQHIILESSLPSCLTRCKQTLFSLDNITSGSLLSSLHPNLLSGFCSYLHSVFSELDHWNKSLDEAWRVTESHFTLIIQYHRHKERADGIEHKICDHYYPLLKEHPIVGRTLSQAELYRAHFTTTLYEPAKELLNQATEILEAMQKVKTSAASLSNTGVSSSLVEAIKNMNISGISKHLTSSIQPFTVHMQQLQEVYVNIHVFHLLFEKALSWYKKVLKFLPESLLHSRAGDSDVSQSEPSLYEQSLLQGGQTRVIYMPPEWLGAVRVFLDRHPPPKEEHINRLDVSTPNVVDKKLRAQARSLALRLRLLQRVLSSTRLPLKLLMAVTGWKFELFGPSHTDKSSSHTNSHSPTRSAASRQSHFMVQPEEDESTAQEGHWANSSNLEDTRNESSGTTSQSKKSVNFDRSTTSSMKSSTDYKSKETSANKADQMSHKRTAIANKIQMRKNSKSLLRAKSVEFSFNSSSTDGSVFDYEKAVSGARQIRGYGKQEGANKELGEMKPGQRPKEGMRPVPQSQQYPVCSEEKVQYGTEELDSSFNGIEDKNNSFYAEQGSDFNNFEDYPEEAKNQFLSEKYEKKSGSETPSSSERYIGLSYRSGPPQLDQEGWSKYHSMEDLLRADLVPEEEFESGIETLDHCHLDPYDVMVKRIKDISVSGLSNIEKLKYVSTLIANSPMTGQNTPGRLSNNAEKRYYSTFDLRERDEVEPPTAQDSISKAQHFSENPVEAVVRMKQKLAKSMEDLRTHHFSTAPNEEDNDILPMELPIPSKRTLTFAPHTGETSKSKDLMPAPPIIVETEWQENISSKVGNPGPDHKNHPSGPPSQNKATTPKNEAGSGFGSQARKEFLTNRKGQHNLTSLEEKGMTHQPGQNAQEHPPHRQRKLSLPRSSHLSSMAGRTFISPSFLRPASSMRNVSTADSQDNMTFDLMKALNLDAKPGLIDSIDSLLKSGGATQADRFPPKSVDDEDQRKRAIPFAQYTDEFLASNSKRNLSSFDQTKSGTTYQMTRPKRPMSLSLDGNAFLDDKTMDVERLNSEAELASKDQEEVANSLRKTQQILEEEEKRRSVSQEDAKVGTQGPGIDFQRGPLLPSESIDNGYGSWASKLVSAPSTSSDGPEYDNAGRQPWKGHAKEALEVPKKPPRREDFVKSASLGQVPSQVPSDIVSGQHL